MVLSMLIVPLQHLLAAQGGNMHAVQVTSTDHQQANHDHMLSTESGYRDINKHEDTLCKNSKTCKFCPDIALFNLQSLGLENSVGYIVPLQYYQSTRFFPELRPPRNT